MGRHTQSTVQHIHTDESDLYDSQGIAMAFNEHFITQIQQMVDDTSASTIVLVQVLTLQHCLSL